MPARTSMCLDCRMLHGGASDASTRSPRSNRPTMSGRGRTAAPVTVCPHDRRHTMVMLGSEAGRDALYREIWHTPFIPMSRDSEWLVAGGLLMPVAMGLVAMSVPAALAAAAVSWGGVGASMAWDHRRHIRADSPPRGRPGHLRLVGWREPRHRGTIYGTATLRAPLTGRPCLAYAVVLRVDEFFGGNVMVIDAMTSTAEVLVDEGPDNARILMIPEGSVEIDAGAHGHHRCSRQPSANATELQIRDRGAIADYLRQRAPALYQDPRPLLPYDIAVESIVPNRAEVEIVGKTVEVPGMYRDAGQRFQVRGTPFVRLRG